MSHSEYVMFGFSVADDVREFAHLTDAQWFSAHPAEVLRFRPIRDGEFDHETAERLGRIEGTAPTVLVIRGSVRLVIRPVLIAEPEVSEAKRA